MTLSVNDLEVGETYTIWQNGQASLYITYRGTGRFYVANGDWAGVLIPDTKTLRIKATGRVCAYEKITKGGSYAGLHTR